MAVAPQVARTRRESSPNPSFPAAGSCAALSRSARRQFPMVLFTSRDMKKAGILAAASVAAASSSVALSSGSNRRTVPAFENEGSSVPSSSKEAGTGSQRDEGGDRFAPRFDGLRFIETLVTAHR